MILATFIIMGLIIAGLFFGVKSLPQTPEFAPTLIPFGSSGEPECISGEKISCTGEFNCPGTRTCTHGSWGSCIVPSECEPGETQFCEAGTCENGLKTCDSCGKWGECIPR